MRLPGEWKYTAVGRDLRIDLLRGFAAFAMIIDHIGGEGSWLYAITGKDRWFTSAAEAFIIISGLVFGMVYARLIARSGIADAMRKALRRSGMLYYVTVGLTLTFIPISMLLALPWAPQDVAVLDGLEMFVGILTLHQTFFLVDIMLMYTLMVLLAVPVLLLLSEGHTRIVLAASWGLWLVWRFWPEQAVFPWPVSGNTVFHIPAWQVLFMTGIVVGFHRPAIEGFVRRLSRGQMRVLITALTVAFVVVFVAQTFAYDFVWRNEDFAYQFLDKPDVRIGRIVASAVALMFGLMVTTYFWAPIRRLTGWLLLPLGQRALLAYGIHVFVVVFTTKFVFGYRDDGVLHPALVTVFQLACVLVVWGIIVAKPRLDGWFGELVSRRQPPTREDRAAA